MEAIEDIYGALEGTARRVRDGVLEANRRSDKNCRNSGDETSEGTSSDGSPDRRSGQQEDGRRMGAPRVDLVGLDLTGLLGRATRLEHDLLELKRRIAPTDLRVTDSPPSNHPSPTTNAASADIATQPCPTQEDQTNEARPMSPAVAALTHRFHSLTSSGDGNQHHLLLAPLHQFTLALFNGGRHIRRQLLSASSSFWSPPACHSSSALAASLLPAPSPFTLATGSHPPAYFAIPQGHPDDDLDGGGTAADDVLTFWHIPDHDEEEEDAKQAFKRTFESVASSLATWEREEVIAEAVSVMQMLESVVEEIVRHVAGLKAHELEEH